MHARIIIAFALLTSVSACDDDSMESGATAESDTDATTTDTAGTDTENDSADTEQDSADDTSGGAATVDEDAIADQAINFNTLELLNDEPLSSQHGLANTMNLWVDADAVAAYESLSEGTVFDEGTYLLKEQLNGDGSLNTVAVMYKGPSGYAPDAGDWFFGLIQPDGSIQLGGQPGACVGCHADVSEQDWAWGLPE